MPEDQRNDEAAAPQDERAGARGPRDKRTPATDMQADDTGTADSGQAQPKAPPAQSVVKQEHKTEHEGGSSGR